MRSKVLLCLGLLAVVSPVDAAPEPLAGELLDLAAGERCPLEETRVECDVQGIVSRIELTQVFRNPFESPIEAVYAFPLKDRRNHPSQTRLVTSRERAQGSPALAARAYR